MGHVKMNGLMTGGKTMDALSHHETGCSFLEKGDDGQAIFHFNKAIELDPQRKVK